MKGKNFTKYIWFYLIHKDKGIVEIPNPIGWREGNRTSKREKDHSISIVIGNSLEYYGLSLEILKDIRYNIGISEKVELLCQIRNPNNPKQRKTVYKGILDLTTFEIKENKCTVKFKKNNLEEILKASKSQKIELEREETLIGTTANTLETKDILIKGRSLFLESKLVSAIDTESNTRYSFNVENRRTTTGSQTITSVIAFPLDISYSSHPEDVTAIASDVENDGFLRSTSGGGQFLTSHISASFFTQSEFDRNVKISLDLGFNTVHNSVSASNFNNDTYRLIIRQHSSSAEDIDDFKNETILFERTYDEFHYDKNVRILRTDIPFDLKQGDFLSLQLLYRSFLNKNVGSDEVSRARITFNDSYLIVRENNQTPEKTRKTIKAYDFGKKLVELITGNENNFYAPILETGIWRNLTLSSGLWIRGFYGVDHDKPEEDTENANDRQRIKASLTDFINFCDTKLAVGVSFKTINGVEKICFEPIKDKYRDKVLISLENQPYDFSRKTIPDMLFTGCKFGDKFADVNDSTDLYEEIFGLSEYNTLSEWSTELNIDENIYSKVSPYRSDGTGKTLALKKAIEQFPSTDTRFDESIFLFHVKNIDANILLERNWQDDFTQQPLNVYSPDDATNLLFTPKQMFKRHNFLFNTELKESIKYLSGRGNNSLITRNGLDITIENEDVPITQRQKFLAEEISFSYPFSNELITKISGQTLINNEEVLNVHGLVQFKNEYGKLEFGYLKELKEDKNLEFKIIAITPNTKKI